MAQDITDANDCIVKVGSSQAGGTSGTLIIDEFELSDTPNKERRWGVGNETAQGRTSGNREIDLSFTHIGQNGTLISDIRAGNFDVVLQGDDYSWELSDVDGEYTVNVSDGGAYELDFDGDALSHERVS
jgi:hypothetical protein